MKNILVRTFVVLALSLVLCALAFSQGVVVAPQTAFKVVNGLTTPIANATITVCAALTGGKPCSPALANSVFSNSALTLPLSNPFFADSTGNYQFAIAPGNYTVTVTATGFTGQSYQLTVATPISLAGGLGDPGANGVVFRNGLNTTRPAASADLIALWTGTCNVSTVLRGDGSCAAGVTSLANLNGGIAPISQTYDFAANSDIVNVVTQAQGDISTKAASTAFVASALPSALVTSGILAEYKMMEGSGTTLTDSSGNSNTATLCTSTNAPTRLPITTTYPAVSGASGTALVPGTGGLSFAGASSQCVQLPAALNAARAWVMYLTWQPTTGSVDFQTPIVGTGAGTTSGGVYFGYQDVSGVHGMTTFITGTAATFTTSRSSIAGTHFLGLNLGGPSSIDHFYFDGGQEALLYEKQGDSSGLQAAGIYQLGGSAAAARGNFLTGQIYYFAAWNRTLSAAEMQQMSAYVGGLMANRGVASQYGFLPQANAQVNNLLADGDSLTCGGSGCSNPYTNFLTLNGTWRVENTGTGGGRVTGGTLNIVTDTQTADIWSDTGAQNNVAVVWAGTNDLALGATANNTLGGLRNYAVLRRKAGFKVLVATMISRTLNDTNKNNYNALIRQEWATFADGLIDMAANPLVGADGASANTNIFSGDATHPLDATKHYIEAPLISQAVNRLYGNRDFSSATTYGSATAAGTAITAASEAGNTVTFTFGANPFAAGAQNISITGVTPAGYNQPCNVQASTGTTITCFNTNTGLGAGTVFGVAQAPSQVDADQYAILNFGAGNFLLQSCVGYTGQNIYLKNINAAGSTVVPNSSEAIDGAATVTVATKATLILQSILTSASAGGCSWKQLQNN